MKGYSEISFVSIASAVPVTAQVVTTEVVVVVDEEAPVYSSTSPPLATATTIAEKSHDRPSNRHGDDVMHGAQRAAYDRIPAAATDVANTATPTDAAPKRVWQTPDFNTQDWIAFTFGTFFVTVGFGMTLYFFLRLVIFDVNGNVKPFQALCLTPKDMDEHVCFLSCAQISRGIICFGQVNIGIISIGQANIGLLFAFGQAALGWGYSFGQLAVGTYIPMAQIGFALYRIVMAQIGLQLLACFYSPITPGDNKPCQRCGSSSSDDGEGRRRRHFGRGDNM